MNEYVASIVAVPRCVFAPSVTCSKALECVEEAGYPSYAFVVDGSVLRGYIKCVELAKGGTVMDIVRPYEAAHLRRVHDMMTVKEYVAGMVSFPAAPLPVLDSEGVFMGAVGIERLAGCLALDLNEEPLSASVLDQSPAMVARSRIVWLLISFGSAFLSVIVIDEFEAATSHIKWAPALMPVCGAMGGNAGLQVGTAVIEAMSVKKLTPGCKRNVKYVTKELAVCTACGIFFALLFGAVAGWLEEPIAGLMTAASLLIMFLWAALGGTAIPLFLASVGIDPVVSVGPILTTLTDLVGYVAFLGLCTLFVPIKS
eukprot:TRINITY_DN3079_c0_g1_i3.p1 TRINITY_DN3079_c0_g1~~TRINITY_DN3079_c0_g1_i3.p1  ORF type:complete len:323 (+),score=74.70 TRINITY_DN3079_c0_g1_i3:32-970(+)